MAKFFIDRPVFAIVTAIVLLLAGIIAGFGLPIAQYPQITLPTIRVAAVYPGASAEVVEQAVAQPIEEQVNGVEGMLYMTSSSSGNGVYNLDITFGLESNADIAAVQVQNRTSQASARLPSEVINSGITTRKQTPDTLMYVALVSPKGSYDELFLANYASINIVETLKRVKGVGNVQLFGAEFGMRLWLRRRRSSSSTASRSAAGSPRRANSRTSSFAPNRTAPSFAWATSRVSNSAPRTTPSSRS